MNKQPISKLKPKGFLKYMDEVQDWLITNPQIPKSIVVLFQNPQIIG